MSIEPKGSPKYWPPLGLPIGSVRAILTLFIVAVVVVNLARGPREDGKGLDLIWTETLLIALAHYFTARRFVSLPKDVLNRLQQDGVIEQDSRPLYLPRHSIRILILATFAGLGFYLFREHRLWKEPQAISLLSIIAAYVLGSIVRTITGWFGKTTGRRPSSFWGDAKAIVVLAVVVLAGLPELLSFPELLPEEAHRIALGLMLFYFGSR